MVPGTSNGSRPATEVPQSSDAIALAAATSSVVVVDSAGFAGTETARGSSQVMVRIRREKKTAIRMA